MRKMILMIVMAVLLPALFVSAQKDPSKTRKKQTARPEIDLSVQPAAAPGKEFDVLEFQLKRKELEGQVVELVFDRVHNLKQTDQGYTVRVTFDNVRGGSAVLLIPEEGLELFEEMAARELRSPLRQSVYVEVIDANFARAVGTRYSKNKPEGQRYSW